MLFAAVVADSLAQAAELEARIKQLPAVAGVDSLSQFISEDQTHKLELVRQIKTEIRPLHFAEADPQPVNLPELSRTLWALHGYLGLALDEVKDQEPELRDQLMALHDAIGELRKTMLEGSPATSEKHALKLGSTSGHCSTTFGRRSARCRLRTTARRCELKTCLGSCATGSWRDEQASSAGLSRRNVWQRENQEEFITQLRTVDPNVTGTPVQLYEYTTLLKQSYEEAAWYSLAAIAVLVFFHFRSLGAVVRRWCRWGSAPCGAGWMGWRGVPSIRRTS